MSALIFYFQTYPQYITHGNRISSVTLTHNNDWQSLSNSIPKQKYLHIFLQNSILGLDKTQ